MLTETMLSQFTHFTYKICILVSKINLFVPKQSINGVGKMYLLSLIHSKLGLNL